MGARKSRAEGSHVPCYFDQFQLLSSRRLISGYAIHSMAACGLATNQVSHLKKQDPTHNLSAVCVFYP